MHSQQKSRQKKNKQVSTTTKQSEPSWSEVIKNLLTGGLWYFTQFIMLLAFVGICITYFMGFAGSIEELRALHSIDDRGAIELHSTKNVDSSLEGRTVFVKGTVKTQDTLKDPNFDISVHGLALHKQMFFYQWERKKLSKGQHFYYEKQWNTYAVDASTFEVYKNNTLIFPLKSSSTYAAGTLGAYKVAASLLEELPLRQNLSLTLTPKLQEDIKEKFLQYSKTVKTPSDSIQTYFSGNVAQNGALLVHKQADNELFLGLDATNPRVGDLRARYTYTPEQTVSFFATVQENSLHLFVDEDGNVSKETIWTGLLSMEDVYAKTRVNNILYFFLNLFLGPLIMSFLIFVELQLLLPRVQEKGYSFTKDTLRKNTVRSLIYTICIALPLSLLAWFL